MKDVGDPGPGGGGSSSPGDLAIFTWFPLATQQLRFRSISQVYLYHPTCQGGPSEPGRIQYYLTFHSTALSSPFMSTDPRRQQDNRVLWPEHNNSQMDAVGLKGTIVRTWAKTHKSSIQLSVIGIYFSGLICIGDSLKMNIIQHLENNSLVFKLHGHYFVCLGSFKIKVPKIRFLEMPRTLSYTGKPSYSKNSLAKMQRTLRALKQIHECNQRLKSDIVSRGLDPEGSDVGISSAASQTLTATTSTASLRQLIFNKQTKQPATKKKEILLMKRIESLKLKLNMLREEKSDLNSRVQETRSKIDYNLLETDNSTDSMTEKFHALAKDKEKLSNWLKTFDEFRSYKEKAASDLVIRRKQLISQLSQIFPLHDPETSLPTIGYVFLPEADNLKDRDETEVCVALGWTAHLTSMVANLLMVPTRYQINHSGSRSSMVDHILDKIPGKERTFPLYPKGVERTRFEYAVYLLNKNIAQLRWHCNQETKDLRTTLRNLHGLLLILTTDEEMVHSSASMRMNLPVAPSVLSGLASAKAFTRGTPPGQVFSIHQDSDNNLTSSDSNETDSEANKHLVVVSSAPLKPPEPNHSFAGSNSILLTEKELPSPTEDLSRVKPAVGYNDYEKLGTSCDNNSRDSSQPKSVILSKNNSENLEQLGQTSVNIDHEIQRTLVSRLENINIQYGVEENGLYEDSSGKENSDANKDDANNRKESVEVGEVAGTTFTESDGDLGNFSQNQANQKQGDEENLINKVDEVQLQNTVDEDSRKVEIGVDADMFWDSVSSRAQVLAVPNSFKTGSKKTFRQF